MKNFDSRVYSISDFLEWYQNDLLELSPHFQRRSVWSEKGKSYLIDTILRGKPIPKILITQKLTGKRTVRVVVDGQQRLRAILGFIDGDFKVSRAHNKEYANSTFDDLPEEVKNEYLKYELGVDVLFDMSYEDMLDIFARINSYSVSLNKQEKINAKYLGYFKQYAFEFGLKYVSYLVDGGVYTKNRISRMAESEMAGDFFVALLEGVQTNKVVEQFYRNYDDFEGGLKDAAEKFDEIMSFIGAIYHPSQLADTNWSKIPLFYTLFTVVGHNLYGLGNIDNSLRISITANDVGKVRVQLDTISTRFDEISDDMENPAFPGDYKQFINFAQRHTTDTSARVFRTEFVCKQLKKALG